MIDKKELGTLLKELSDCLLDDSQNGKIKELEKNLVLKDRVISLLLFNTILPYYRDSYRGKLDMAKIFKDLTNQMRHAPSVEDRIFTPDEFNSYYKEFIKLAEADIEINPPSPKME